MVASFSKMLLDLQSVEVAQQMTLIDFNIFKNIKVLYHLFFGHPEKLGGTPLFPPPFTPATRAVGRCLE